MGPEQVSVILKVSPTIKITFNFFHSGDGHLTEEESSFKKGEKLFLTYNKISK